jgi:hypothetical protein
VLDYINALLAYVYKMLKVLFTDHVSLSPNVFSYTVITPYPVLCLIISMLSLHVYKMLKVLDTDLVLFLALLLHLIQCCA